MGDIADMILSGEMTEDGEYIGLFNDDEEYIPDEDDLTCHICLKKLKTMEGVLQHMDAKHKGKQNFDIPF